MLWNSSEFFGILWNSLECSKEFQKNLLEKLSRMQELKKPPKTYVFMKEFPSNSCLNYPPPIFEIAGFCTINPRIPENSNESQRLPGNSSGFQRIRKNSREFERIPTNSREFHRIPENSRQSQRIPENSDRQTTKNARIEKVPKNYVFMKEFASNSCRNSPRP